MSSRNELRFPAGIDQDEAHKELAFQRYRLEHGIHDSRRLGDMPLQVISTVLLAAHRLKTQEAAK